MMDDPTRSRAISHEHLDEEAAEKARWFQSLTLEERMDLLCEFTDMMFENQPSIAEVGRAPSSTARILVVSGP